MDIETGLNRLAVVIAGLGVLWFVLCFVVAVTAFSSFVDGALVAIIGALGMALAFAVAWIVRGFGRKKQ